MGEAIKQVWEAVLQYLSSSHTFEASNIRSAVLI